jgi:predicted CXXCH cytochrome family protein
MRWLVGAAVLCLVMLQMALPDARGQDDQPGTDWYASDELAGEETADSDSGDEIEGPTLPWTGESPFWVFGQEFSAIANAPFIGTAECLYCHEDKRAGFLKTAHARGLMDDKLALERQGCESCHGAGGAHAVLRSRGAIFAFDWKEPQRETNICLRCHEWLSTPEEWQQLPHAKSGLRCSTCHDPHVADGHRYRFLLRSDQDAMCAGCHGDVSDDFTKLLLTRQPSDLCLRCHVEKGGPYRFVHMAIEEGLGDGCLTCHRPHGSDLPWLLTGEGRALCEQCHTDRQTHYPAQTCYTAGCHSNLHGSNHSPLFLE